MVSKSGLTEAQQEIIKHASKLEAYEYLNKVIDALEGDDRVEVIVSAEEDTTEYTFKIR